ncbi:MAG: Uncharacterized protein G01um10143_554 [Parcubacteria group bacterium Gr01-1014_3]|nr:MAG: Uncharacterized protein G01um10143_554 [Parcubacteria group bacterium Gr01-1014_3]
MMNKIIAFKIGLFKKIMERKLMSSGIAFMAILVIYFIGGALFGGSADPRYLVAQVYRGDLVVSISGSGQVLASNQLEVKPKTSGDVVYVGVTTGQEVYAGQLIAIVDYTDAEKAVRDAQLNLEKANISLQKLEGIENASVVYRGAEDQANEGLVEAYDNALGVATASFLDLPGIVSGLERLLYGTDFGNSEQWNMAYYADMVTAYGSNGNLLKEKVQKEYKEAKADYDSAFKSYKLISLSSDQASLDQATGDIYKAVKSISEAVKSALDLIQAYHDSLVADKISPNQTSVSHLETLNDYYGKISKHFSALSSARNGIQDNKENLVNAGFDIKSQRWEVERATNGLGDAKKKLADCYIRAPFAGILAKISVKKSDTVSSGTVIATLVTRQQIAEISLNEVDAAKVQAGQKATLTFDALPELKLSGLVAEIDGIGTVSQGVVTYNAKVSFEAGNTQIKPGMSVTVEIATLEKLGVLLAPSAAVKQRGLVSYVEVIDGELTTNLSAGANIGAVLLENPARQQIIEIGDSNDEFVEILNGAEEGDKIVVREIQANSAPRAQQNSLFGAPATGVRTTGGSSNGGFRVQVR